MECKKCCYFESENIQEKKGICLIQDLYTEVEADNDKFCTEECKKYRVENTKIEYYNFIKNNIQM